MKLSTIITQLPSIEIDGRVGVTYGVVWFTVQFKPEIRQNYRWKNIKNKSDIKRFYFLYYVWKHLINRRNNKQHKHETITIRKNKNTADGGCRD